MKRVLKCQKADDPTNPTNDQQMEDGTFNFYHSHKKKKNQIPNNPKFLNAKNRLNSIKHLIKHTLKFFPTYQSVGGWGESSISTLQGRIQPAEEDIRKETKEKFISILICNVSLYSHIL